MTMMNRVFVLLLILCVVPTAIAEGPQWTWVNTWSADDGTRTTEKFTIRGSQFRIKWQTGKADYGSFHIMVFNDKGDLVEVAANTNKPGTSGLSYVHRSGRHYLTISGAMSWLVSVEEEL
jgi:hypothetical protein